jgi:hypothetical protein
VATTQLPTKTCRQETGINHWQLLHIPLTVLY